MTGTADRAAVAALVAGGDPAAARGADLYAAALELDEQHLPGFRIAQWLHVPHDQVRGWLRDAR